eukprot:TRINITY_DN7922_c0_g1_i2.p1 TRINITY_DN7922_c0_g1~~TRINITY_DN7922_c0_g1_i2.p1  ORF type:complete len:150 (+),score=26.61 TRINITY_DN7922_c0_g1_i2:64-513(+)
MAYLLPSLNSKTEIDDVILNTVDRVLVLRIGRAADKASLQLDDILAKCQRDLEKMATIYIVEADAVPEYVKYFDVTLIPATLFFFNAVHMKCDYGTQDHTKFIGAFRQKQDVIDLVECFYRGALKGKHIISSPLDQSSIPKYELLYKGI